MTHSTGKLNHSRLPLPAREYPFLPRSTCLLRAATVARSQESAGQLLCEAILCTPLRLHGGLENVASRGLGSRVPLACAAAPASLAALAGLFSSSVTRLVPWQPSAPQIWACSTQF